MAAGTTASAQSQTACHVVRVSPGAAATMAGAARKRVVPTAVRMRVAIGRALAMDRDPVRTPSRAPTPIPTSHSAMTRPHAISEPPMAAMASRTRRDWETTVETPSNSVTIEGVGIVVFTRPIVDDLDGGFCEMVVFSYFGPRFAANRGPKYELRIEETRAFARVGIVSGTNFMRDLRAGPLRACRTSPRTRSARTPRESGRLRSAVRWRPHPFPAPFPAADRTRGRRGSP